ncbi:MAG TPA: SUMF1/EgtB/PvdO family nonheme iron enzyme [Fimbriimonadaceae bacterium]
MLCRRILESQENAPLCRIYGKQGEAQDGIDIVVPKPGAKMTVCQCKNVAKMGSADIREAVGEYLAGRWKSESSRFILAVRCDLRGVKVSQTIIESADLLHSFGIELLVWDLHGLDLQLKKHPQIVKDFFGLSWSAVFCGHPEELVFHESTDPDSSNLELHLENYRSYIAQQWNGLWSKRSSSRNGKTVFIEDQQLMALKRDRISRDPRLDLEAQYPVRNRASFSLDENPSPWKVITRAHFIKHLSEKSKLAGKRAVVLSEAGVGKTTNMRWINYQMNRDSRRISVLIDVAELPQEPSKLIEIIAEQLRKAKGNNDVPLTELLGGIRDLRNEGRLSLLIDALDQVDARNLRCLETLRHLLSDKNWTTCPIVLGSRFYALHRDWNQLFEDHLAREWTFIQVCEFDESQQRRFLGGKRFSSIPEHAREILRVPRVLLYLLRIHDDAVDDISTSSDVYTLVVGKLLSAGIWARYDLVGLTLYNVQLILSAVAFEMVSSSNYHAVDGSDIEFFLRRVSIRCSKFDVSYDLDWTWKRFSQISSMNEFLKHALFEGGCPVRLQWRNRSLLEYFAALWMARYASTCDEEILRRIIYVPTINQSYRSWGPPKQDEYREVWQFATEMPQTMHHGCSWVLSMLPLYKQKVSHKRQIRRSTEMIYRSWSRMHAYARGENPSYSQESISLARMALDSFSLEYPRFLMGEHGIRSKRIAVQLLSNFVRVPTLGQADQRHNAVLGSPNDEHGRLVDELETAVTITSFDLAQYTVTVEQFKLFNPNHQGLSDYYRSRPRYPVVHVSWFDAWAFCRWLGEGFRLPSEIEWEFACRAGSRGAYCFGNDVADLSAYARVGGYFHTRLRPLPVGCLRPNDWLLFDMHGNCWEWCDSNYTETISSQLLRQSSYSEMVIRGGSCFDGSWKARSSKREARMPRTTEARIGFRVARDCSSERHLLMATPLPVTMSENPHLMALTTLSGAIESSDQ